MARKKRKTSSEGKGLSLFAARSKLGLAQEELRVMKERTAESEVPEESREEWDKGLKESLKTASKKRELEAKEEQVKKLKKQASPTRRLIKGFGAAAEKLAKKKVKARKILRPKRLGVRQSTAPPAPYIPIYMKETIEQEKRNMFFS